MSSARDTASSADVASPSPGTGIPYASATRLASGALRASRPSARTSSSTSRTVVSRAVPVWVVVEAIKLPLLEFRASSCSWGTGTRPSDRARLRQLLDLVGLVVEELGEDLAAVLAQQGRAPDLHRRVRQRERAADRREPPALGVVDVDDHALRAQALVLEEVLRAEHRPAGHVDRVELAERLPLGLRQRPLLDEAEDLV